MVLHGETFCPDKLLAKVFFADLCHAVFDGIGGFGGGGVKDHGQIPRKTPYFFKFMVGLGGNGGNNGHK